MAKLPVRSVNISKGFNALQGCGIFISLLVHVPDRNGFGTILNRIGVFMRYSIISFVLFLAIQSVAHSSVTVRCSWDNSLRDSENIFATFELSDGRKLNDLYVSISNNARPDVEDYLNNRMPTFKASTGKEVLESFYLDEYSAYRNAMRFDENNKLVFGYYSLDAGIMSLVEGPVEVTARIPDSIPLDKVGSFGKLEVRFSDGKKHTATCGLREY